MPETFDMVYQWRQLLDDYTAKNGGDARIFMTEAYSDINHTMLYYGTPDGKTLGAHFTFNFYLITDINITSTAQNIADTLTKWLDAIPEIYTSNWVLGNHDNHRVATRFGVANADGFNMLKSLLPGVVVTYNGEEIGQENGEVSYEEGKDPSARDPAIFEKVSRDFERTPYQWDDTTNAGFNTGAKPWLPVSEKYVETNLKKEKSDAKSHFKVYQGLAQLRANPVVISGNTTVKAVDEYTVLVKRSYGGNGLALVFNAGNDTATVNVYEYVSKLNKIVLTNIDSSRETG